ncbi:winged helix-turn-helix transcriptional regulator [Archangium primigenium]|uniref:winged helix-turn-helix transcriptional regulator n=1 Tax=[Archangium] primigenium TaxID=2792470 RepID=UPI00195CB4DA|nr:helix-turn-helix domain-containing protein [Archangium primigenium]MBM7119036.1 helix-turn-helix transcriptional regulator [Archangium primigenium]
MAKQVGGPRECSLASALEAVGEKWSLLVLREVFYGVRRFEGIAHHTGAPRDVLTARLRKLVEAGVLRRVPYSERPVRQEYHLTEAGAELAPVLLGLLEWGRKWTPAGPALAAPFVHACGAPLQAALTCGACGGRVTGATVSLDPARVPRT